MKSVTQLAALALLSFAAAAHAEMRTFNFEGVVTQSMPMAPAQARITGSFSYDPSAKPASTVGDAAGPGFGIAFYQVQAPLRATVNGHKIECNSVNIDVFNNMGGNVEDMVSVSCQPMTLDGTYLIEGAFSITFTTGPGSIHALRSTALPRNLPVGRYDAVEGVMVVDGSSNGTVLQFAVRRVVPTQRERDDD